MVCFQRDGFIPVPGCIGHGKKDFDYCANKYQTVCSLLNEFSTQATACSERISNVNAYVEKAKTYYEARLAIANKAKQIEKAIEKIEKVLDKLGPIIYKIPKVHLKNDRR